MSNQPRDRYVYGIPYEPGHESFDGKPCYIGMGKNGRKDAHVYLAKKFQPHSRAFYAYLADCISRGIAINSYVIASNMMIDEAAAVEVALIEHYGRLEDGGCLFNLDSGGYGGSNRPPSTRMHISIAHKGRPKSPEHRAKIAAAGTGKTRSVTSRARQSATTMGRPKSEETRARMAAASVARELAKRGGKPPAYYPRPSRLTSPRP